jgi:hypothetical protein
MGLPKIDYTGLTFFCLDKTEGVHYVYLQRIGRNEQEQEDVKLSLDNFYKDKESLEKKVERFPLLQTQLDAIYSIEEAIKGYK